MLQKYKRGITSAQEATELKLINSNNLGQFYNHVKKTVHRSGIAPLKTDMGELVLGDREKAELLNDYFVSVCTDDDGVLPTLAARTDEKGPTLELIVFRSEQIKRLLKKLKSKTSSGPDGLPLLFLKIYQNIWQGH